MMMTESRAPVNIEVVSRKRLFVCVIYYPGHHSSRHDTTVPQYCTDNEVIYCTNLQLAQGKVKKLQDWVFMLIMCPGQGFC